MPKSIYIYINDLVFTARHTNKETNQQSERDQINRRRSFRHRRRRQPRREIRKRNILVRSHVVLEIERVAQRIVAEIHRRIALALVPLMMMMVVLMSAVAVAARDLDARLDAAATISDLELLRG